MNPIDAWHGALLPEDLTASAAEASPWHQNNYEITGLANRHHRYHPKAYSEGDRNTAAIVGAVAGYVIAKNT